SGDPSGTELFNHKDTKAQSPSCLSAFAPSCLNMSALRRGGLRFAYPPYGINELSSFDRQQRGCKISRGRPSILLDFLPQIVYIFLKSVAARPTVWHRDV